MTKSSKLRTGAGIFASLMIATVAMVPTAAEAKIVSKEFRLANTNGAVPLYSWHDDHMQPRAVLISLHGSVQHGNNFKELGNRLAPQGIATYSMDLRGHGKWAAGSAKRVKVDYSESSRDLIEVAAKLRRMHPNTPLFCIGESVGAAVALRAAKQNPALFDGLILASPGTKPAMNNFKNTMASIKQGIKSLGSKIDLSSHIEHISEDHRSSEEMLADPALRKVASATDLLHTALFIRESASDAEEISPRTSVLVLQGELDSVISVPSSQKLYEKLAATDKSLTLFPNYGHLLVTGSYLKDDVVHAVQSWLLTRAQTQVAQKR